MSHPSIAVKLTFGDRTTKPSREEIESGLEAIVGVKIVRGKVMEVFGAIGEISGFTEEYLDKKDIQASLKAKFPGATIEVGHLEPASFRGAPFESPIYEG